MHNPTHPQAEPFSAREFRALGLGGLAYVRPAHDGGTERFTIHTADGAEVAEAATLAEALATIRANELEPVWLH